ncbi:heterokaryon incompatibility protein-domain-containing protein [Nemania sp. FL0031]|nr:heterokaryon incompatibility protein-domain-containing protein [Nemania sp. FL0031]
MTEIQFYHHQPLSSPRCFRIINLEPARSPKAPINCTLSELDLNQVDFDNLTSFAPYEALSYLWGDRVGTVPVMCSGRQLLVTPNCHGALIRLRKSFRARRLFIDAICIDQGEGSTSQREREEQVKLMGQVYAIAARVIIWLGPSRKLTGRLFKIMKVMHWHEKERPDTFAYPGPLHAQARRFSFIHDAVHGRLSSLREEFWQLIRHPWFTRTWTTQEQVLADNNVCLLLCGNHQIRWVTFSSAFYSLLQMWPTANDLFENLQLRMSLRYELSRAYYELSQFNEHSRVPTRSIGWSPNYEAIWKGIRNLNSTVPQDKIFGMYSLIIQLGINIPEPDYSMTEADLFEKATRAMIEARQTLELLLYCVRLDSQDHLPSWVPDWSTKNSEVGYPYPERGGFRFLDQGVYKSARGTHVTQQRVIRQGTLALKGIIISNIEFCSAPSYIEYGDGSASRFLPFYSFADACRRFCQHVASSSPDPSVLNAVRRTLLFSYYGELLDYRGKESNEEIEAFNLWFDLMLHPNHSLLAMSEHEAWEERCNQVLDSPDLDLRRDPSVELIATVLHNYNQRDLNEPIHRAAGILASTANYAMMILGTGHFARGFLSCKQYDVVALLAGSKVPVALRPDGNGRYRFVAPLYVDGIMFGEAWPEDESELIDILLV